MNSDIVGQLIDIGIDLVISLIVWQYYKKSTYPPSARYSTFAPRFWSGSVDSCVLWPLSFIASGLLLLNMPAILASVLICIQSVAWLLYTVVLHARYGQTVGKMVTKVRVVDFRTEAKISWR